MAAINVIKKKGEPILAGSNRFAFDYWLLLAIGSLLVFGMLMVFSTTFDIGYRVHENPVYFVTRQMIALGIGLAFIVAFLQFDYHILIRWNLSLLLMLATIMLLVFLLFFGREDYGATRSLADGSYQPSELAKLAAIIYISHWLYSKGDKIKGYSYGLIPFIVITGLVVGLIFLQPAVSSSILVGLIAVTLYFVAGADLRQLLLIATMAALIVLLGMTLFSHTAERVNSYIATLQNPEEASYQVKQALAALANGGPFGVGIGVGNQKFGPLPLAHTDGVFAIIGEELGLFGTLLVIFLIGFLVWRGFRVAARARDMFGFLMAVGVTVWIAYQALIHIAVITVVIPVTGMTLPFISYGGSSILALMVGVGILLNISRDAALGQRPKRQQPE